VHQAAWPTEDYELARSLLDVETPEDDLFAGVREALERMGS
jgi:mycothiol S-conjugate amidase